jgi:HAD superfamily phosphatase (TIGR01668 family)
LLSKLRPNLFLDSVQAIDLRLLRRRGIRGVVLDLDNTLAGWRALQPSLEVATWLKGLRSHQIGAVILSNNGKGRVGDFARSIGVPCIPNARKPRVRGFLQAMQMLGTTPQTTAVIGDQVFTDILGGNRAGFFTILVSPLTREEFVGTKAVRRVEGMVLRHFARQGLQRPTHAG